MTLKNVLKIMWKFSQEIQCVDIINEIDCGKNSLSNLYSLFRKLCKKYYHDNPILLGDHGSVINFDETLIRHKPKYHRGRATYTVFTDCWVNYKNIKTIGLHHETVNHSLHFVYILSLLNHIGLVKRK